MNNQNQNPETTLMQNIISQLKAFDMWTYDDLEDLNENIEDNNEAHYSKEYWNKLTKLRELGLIQREQFDELFADPTLPNLPLNEEE